MITKHRFILRAYRAGGGSLEDMPRWFIVELTPAQAAHYLRKMALVNEVQKVDHSLQNMNYREDPGAWWHFLNPDEDGPPLGEDPASVENQEVEVYDHRIFWTCYHEGSDAELVSEDVNRHQLQNLAKGEDPSKPDPAEFHDSPFSDPLQTFTQLVVQAAIPQAVVPPLPPAFAAVVPANPGEMVEVTFEAPDAHDEPDPDDEGENDGDDGGEPEPNEGGEQTQP